MRTIDSPPGDGWVSHPVHRGIVAVAIEDPATAARGLRTNTGRDEFRGQTRRLLTAALESAGIRPAHHELLGSLVAGREDGVVALIRPVDEVPKTLLLGTVVPALSHLVVKANQERPPHRPPLRLRVAVHSGEVHRDGPDVFGEALDIAFRLVESPRVRDFAQAVDDPVTLVITEEMYWSIVRHGYPGIDPAGFVPLARIHAGRRRQIWVHIGSWHDRSDFALADSGLAAD
jgi:hypothetical protein